MKYFYLDFVWPIKDYICTLNAGEFIFDWIIPLVISASIFFLCGIDLCSTQISTYNGYVINALAILIGFSITSITILATSDNEKTKELKEYQTNRSLGNKSISLYQLIFITFSFALLMELALLVSSLIYSLVYSSEQYQSGRKTLFFVNTLLLFHVVLLNIRNITNFYNIFRTVKS